jgi:tape measure domain-containing protein
VAVANIAIEVNGQQAANALKQITTASRQLESAVENTTGKVKNQNSATSSASNQLKNYTRSTQAATAATNGLKGAASNLLGAFTAISAAKFVFAKTAELQAQTKSLEVLTGSASKANQIIKELQQLGAVTPFTSTELIDSAKRLNAFGVEGDKVVGTTRRLADVAGATGAELQGLVTAYGQVQAKGRLQGEELLQFQERGVALQEELRKMYGLSGEEFQKALSKGRISAEAVEVAIQRLTDAGGKYANGAVAQSGTLQGKFSTLQDSVDELARVIGQKLAPALSSFIDNTTGVVKAITDLPDPVKNATGELIKLGLQFLVVKKAIEAVIAIRAAYIGAVAAITVATAASGTAATTSASAFALYTTNVRTLQAASIATAGSVSGLSAALLGLAGIGIVTVGINYVITQTGAVLGSADAAQKSLAARSQQSLAGQLKGKTVEERQKMLKTTQKNLANDRKLASTLALQIRAQDARAESAAEMAAPADRAKLIEVQARVKTNQARIKAITSIPLEKPKKPELPPTPALLAETGGGTKKGSKKKKAKDFTEQIANSGTMLDLARSQFDIEGKILEARVAENTQLVLNLEAQKQLLQVNADIAKIKADKDMPAAQKKIELARLAIQSETVSRQLNFDITAFQKQAIDSYPQYISGIMSAASGYSTVLEYSKQLTVEQEKQKVLADGIANTIGQGMTSAFDALISGTENFGTSLRNIASGVLKDIAKQLIQIYVINSAINAISSFFGPKTGGFGGGIKFNPASFSMGSLLPGRAMGGPVSAGKPYMVGERGPELFMPRQGGSIIPNNALGGGSTNVVVNVDASGSNVQGDQAQAKQLGVAVSAAVQAELIKQQRPGGLLAGTRR